MIDDEILWRAAVSNLQFGKITAIADQHAEVVSEIRRCDPIEAATVFSALLCRPELQANCVRLEALIHLSCAYAEGVARPTKKQVSAWFAALQQGMCGIMEDPAEDVFVTLVSTPRGNFKVLPGIWESAGFYLQRILNAMERLEPSNIREEILRPVEALLLLSNEVCKRAKLERYMLGEDTPQTMIPKKIAATTKANQSLVRFTSTDLEQLGISLDSLTPFVFTPNHRQVLIDESIGHSKVERTPLGLKDDTIHFLLPTAVVPAIQRYLFECFERHGNRELLLGLMKTEYEFFLSELPLLGSYLSGPIQFSETGHGRMASLMSKVDVGRYLHLVFILDDLEGFGAGGLMHPNMQPDRMLPDIDASIGGAYGQATADSEFVGMSTIFCVCGVGRVIHYAASDTERSNWHFKFLSPADLAALSFTTDFDPVVLFRLLDVEGMLASTGVELINVNGLLNLAAWSRELHGDIVPHADLPEDFYAGSRILAVPQNSLRKLRHEVAIKGDEHRALDIRGELVPVRKRGDSFFAEDIGRPLYVGLEFRPGRGGFSLLYEGEKRNWWAELSMAESIRADYRYARWLLVETWLGRIAPVLDRGFRYLPNETVLWRCIFEGQIGDSKRPTKKSSYEAVLASITVASDPESSTVTLFVGQEFEHAIFHPENIAEKALVHRAIEGFNSLTGNALKPEEVEVLLENIIPSSAARQSHAFPVRDFRHSVRNSILSVPITIHPLDDAALKMGLGWRCRAYSDGSHIEGRKECTDFLNKLVQNLTEKLCEDLQQFSRQELVNLCLANYESALNDRDHWRRTSAAVEALKRDKESTRQAIVDHQGKLNATIEGCRAIAEMALVECPMGRGRKPGQVDLSRLMARVLQIIKLGGCSDAIHWEAMEPTIRIAPLGDVLMNFGFHEQVLDPFGRAIIGTTIQNAIEEYAQHYSDIQGPSDGPRPDPAFLTALRAEWNGVSLDDALTMLDFLQEMGLETNSAIITCRRSKLLKVKTERGELTPHTARQLLQTFSSRPRGHWNKVDLPYDEKDIQLWRFKRRLSLLRKPLIQLNDDADPLITFAPGMIRDALVYQVEQFHRGELSRDRLFSTEMKSWKANVDGSRGKAFELEVQQRLEELGWKTRHSVKITELLKRSLDRDYGEVDVLVWHENSGRIVVIECKDVLFRKTPGEVAEQLTDFKGKIKPNGRRDELLKHLDRLEILRDETEALKKFCQLDASPKIEGLLVFRNPVPMQWAWERLKEKTAISTFDTIQSTAQP